MTAIKKKVCDTCKRNLAADEMNFGSLPKGLYGLKNVCRDCESRKRFVYGSGSKDRIRNKYKVKKSVFNELAEDLDD